MAVVIQRAGNRPSEWGRATGACDHIAFHHPETLATRERNIIFFLSANGALERHVTPRPNENPTAPHNFQLSGYMFF